jgi:hypothetical protein
VHVTGVLAAIVCLLLVPLGASAQRNVQRTPEGTHTLVNKDVGDERWVITLDERTGIVTGNVPWPRDFGRSSVRGDIDRSTS